jgi:hypothetical protein
MNVAQLKTWNVNLPIGNMRYHDEGYVASINEKIKQIYQSYGETDYPVLRGESLGFYIRQGLDVHIMYLRRPSLVLDIQNRAHEEFHAAEECGGIDFLSAIVQGNGINIDFRQIPNEQVRANVGALYVLDQRGFSPKDLGKYIRHQEMAPAVKIWNKIKPAKRSFFSSLFSK